MVEHGSFSNYEGAGRDRKPKRRHWWQPRPAATLPAEERSIPPKGSATVWVSPYPGRPSERLPYIPSDLPFARRRGRHRRRRWW